MTPDNRALWELVEKWKAQANADDSVRAGYLASSDLYSWKCAEELAAILESPVVVGEDLDRMCQAFYENKGNMKWEKLSDCWKDNYRSNMTAALESMVRGES